MRRSETLRATERTPPFDLVFLRLELCRNLEIGTLQQIRRREAESVSAEAEFEKERLETRATILALGVRPWCCVLCECGLQERISALQISESTLSIHLLHSSHTQY